MSTKREDTIMIKVENVANPDAHWTQVDASNCGRIKLVSVSKKYFSPKSSCFLEITFFPLPQNTNVGLYLCPFNFSLHF